MQSIVDIEICKIHADLNVADPLTKLLSQAKHDHTSLLFECYSHGDVNQIIDSSASGRLKEICPRGNNKVVILYFLIHDKGLLFMLESY